METETKEPKIRKKLGKLPFLLIPLSYFFIEVFGFIFLRDQAEAFSLGQLWPLAFGLLWAIALGAAVRVLPGLAGRIVYGITYFLSYSYAVAQTGYYNIFTQMMWLTDFTYASEGSDYISVVLGFPLSWWISMGALLALGIVILVKFPNKSPKGVLVRSVSAGIAVLALVTAALLPQLTFLKDKDIKFARSDYGRSQSAEAAYKNMFNAHRLYEICGLNQTAVKDLWANILYPHTPGYQKAMEAGRAQVDEYFAKRPAHENNDMTGIFKGKNVVLVLMESMDDWLISPHTPHMNKLIAEGINFTHFYTPAYGGIRTFNTEFCTNNGFFLSSKGGKAFDYVNNDFDYSFPNTLKNLGYSPKVFHYNDPSFYSRGVYSLAMGYDEYVYYGDYVEKKDDLYDDRILFTNDAINDVFFREGPTLNFIITRSAHLSYKYNEVLSHWGLKRYPDYRGYTGNEETDCAYLKARLVDDMFGKLMEELEAHDQLDNTVIIALTDHYTYGYKNLSALYELSGVNDPLLLEKTPFFIWAKDLEPMEVTKTANTSDMLPTMLNLFGIEPEVSYIGRDIFDPQYAGFAPFSDGSWVSGSLAYNAKSKKLLYLNEYEETEPEQIMAMTEDVAEFVRINNQILDTDYYAAQ